MKKRAKDMLGLGVVAAFLAVGAASVSAQTLTHRYSFSDPVGSWTFSDSVGGAAWTGDLLGTAYLDGSSLQLDGYGSFGAVPAGIVSGYGKVSIEFWATFSDANPVWTRVFAFGSQDGAGNMATGLDYCHYAGGDWQNLGLRTAGANLWANNPGGLNGRANVHVTVVVDPDADLMYYYNGTLVASNPGVNGDSGQVPPLSGINDTLCLIGKSLYEVDPTLQGSIDEFRVYDGVVAPARVAINDAAGPDRYVTDEGALQSVHLSSPVNPLSVGQESRQVFTGDFANVTGVNLVLYGGATFNSTKPDVLTVTPEGLVKAVSPGTADVEATFGGMTARSSLTVLSVPAVLAHRYSFAGDASDSVGAAHGTLAGTVSIAGGKAVLDGAPGSSIELPGGTINIPGYTSVTFDAWVDFGDVPPWCRLFDFGEEGGSNEIYLAPRVNNGGQHWISQNIPGGRTTAWRGAWAALSAHVTVVIDPAASKLAVYRDGVLEYARHDASAPLSLVSSSAATLGRSLVNVDPFMPGAMDEFRIYRGALSPAEIALVHRKGPDAIGHDIGALVSIDVEPAEYPAFSGIVPPRVLANYAHLEGFNLLPNNSAVVNGLVLTSSDPAVVEVLPNAMLRTHRPGTAVLTASYLGKTDSATVVSRNLAVLTHRYTFETDASDAIGSAHGTLQGGAQVAGGNLVLDGSSDTYVELPPGLLKDYDAVTIDAWVQFNAAATWARLWYFGDDRENEFYVAPSVNGATAHRYSTGFPVGGSTMDISPAWENQRLHITSVYGNGAMELYINGVSERNLDDVTGRLSQVGDWHSWIGRSPYPDPFMNCSVEEFRVYRGRLSPEEIRAADVLGPEVLPNATGAVLEATLSGAGLDLTWPVAAAGAAVQAAGTLAGPWTTLSQAPTLEGDVWQVTVPAEGEARFFRLWR
ncbi:MAG TPA: hypothetical protein PK640_12265 [Verrucomicrobiota bacterium]|nr:hypothetical protein [Verrucomicrobiota bacterium]